MWNGLRGRLVGAHGADLRLGILLHFPGILACWLCGSGGQTNLETEQIPKAMESPPACADVFCKVLCGMDREVEVDAFLDGGNYN